MVLFVIGLLFQVTDFGLSKQLFGHVKGRDVFNPDWLAPEIILNQPYSISSDVFSYGIILWELVSLQHPFDEYSVRRVVARVVFVC